jgi:hypothetical protein
MLLSRVSIWFQTGFSLVSDWFQIEATFWNPKEEETTYWKITGKTILTTSIWRNWT